MRQVISTLIEQIVPLDTLEATHRQDALQWIERGAELFRIKKPATPPKHLVSYFVVVDPDARRVLLVDHLKAQKWLPPGGHVDVNEHPRDTVAREAQEELSLTASFLLPDPLLITQTVTVGLTAGHTDVSLWFVIHAPHTTDLVYDPSEFKGINWFSYEEVLNMDIEQLDPHMHRFLRKWMLRTEQKST